MKLSRTIAYGVHAMLQIAKSASDVPIPASQIARQGHLPERFLVQILRCLVNRGLLKSACGVAGGYTLARPARQISLRDIVEAFDNPLAVVVPVLDCMSPAVRARIGDTLQGVAHAARAALQLVSVADMLEWERQARPATDSEWRSAADCNLPLIKSNEYEAPADHSAIIH